MKIILASMPRIRTWLNRIAHPSFDCEDCIGMSQYGCQCQYYNASAPGVGPTRLQKIALWLLGEE